MFGDRIRNLRKEYKLTQEELGKRINVTKVSISGYENGNRSPDTETLQKLADLFKVSTDYLLGRTDNRDKHKLEDDVLDPKLNIFFKEIKEESPERQEQLRKIWEIIKNEGK